MDVAVKRIFFEHRVTENFASLDEARQKYRERQEYEYKLLNQDTLNSLSFSCIVNVGEKTPIAVALEIFSEYRKLV
jgi:hypothetical protein